jgi:hypothetical protein
MKLSREVMSLKMSSKPYIDLCNLYHSMPADVQTSEVDEKLVPFNVGP